MQTLTQIPTTHNAPEATAPARGGLRKVSFGAIKPKADTKTSYPVFPDDTGQAAILAARIRERQDQFDALDGALKTDKAELKQMVSPFYFGTNSGKHDVPSSISVQSPDGEVLVTFQNRYSLLPDEAGILTILGDKLELFFGQTFEIKIKSDKLGTKAQEFVTALQDLAVGFNCADALEIKEGVKPTSDFHAARHLQLTPAQNMELEQACPIIAMIKTKGRSK